MYNRFVSSASHSQYKNKGNERSFTADVHIPIRWNNTMADLRTSRKGRPNHRSKRSIFCVDRSVVNSEVEVWVINERKKE